MLRIVSQIAALILIHATVALVSAKDAAGTKDHPQVKRITGSEIMWGKTVKFDELNVPLERIEFDYDKQKFKPTKKETVEGAHTILYYRLPGDASTLEGVRQYEAELTGAGFTKLFAGANEKLDDGYNRFVAETFPAALKTPQLQYLHEFNHDDQRYLACKGTSKTGGTMFVTVYAFGIKDESGTGYGDLHAAYKLTKGTTVVRVDVLETQAMEARMTVVKADEIEKTIEKTGRIAIYGVYFDTDKAEIKPESSPSLAEMAKAIKDGDGRKFLIVGHTDNQGGFEHNQGLSQRRATAVTKALTSQHGVAAGSVIAVGVGMAAPIAPNTDDAGRAKNRRVEIVGM